MDFLWKIVKKDLFQVLSNGNSCSMTLDIHSLPEIVRTIFSSSEVRHQHLSWHVVQAEKTDPLLAEIFRNQLSSRSYSSFYQQEISSEAAMRKWEQLQWVWGKVCASPAVANTACIWINVRMHAHINAVLPTNPVYCNLHSFPEPENSPITVEAREWNAEWIRKYTVLNKRWFTYIT